MKPKHRLTQVLLLVLSGVSLASIALIGLLWISYAKKQTEVESQRITSEYIESWEKTISLETNRICDYIEAQTSASQIKFYTNIKSRVYDAWNMLTSLESNHQTEISDEDRQKLFLGLITYLNKGSGQQGYFCADLSGRVLLNGNDPLESEGEGNLPRPVDQKELEEILSSVDNIGEGFYHFSFDKNVSPGSELPVAFFKLFEPFNWIIGASEFNSTFEKSIEKELLGWADNVPLPAENNLLIMTYDGEILSYTDPSLVGSNIFADDKGTGLMKVAAQIIRGAKDRNKDFQRFTLTDPYDGQQLASLGYYRALPNWHWVVVSWIYSRNLDAVLAEQQASLVSEFNNQIKRVIVISLTMLIIIVVISRFISRMSRKSFTSFYNFFENAATTAIEINPEEQGFSEFVRLAEAANRMIYQRNLAETRLKESEEKFRTVFDVSPQIIAVIDNNRNLVEANAEFSEHLKLPMEEAIGKSLDELFNFDRDLAERLSRELEEKKFVKALEIDWLRSDKKAFKFLFFGKKLNLDKKEFVLCLFIDITALKEAEKEKMLLQEKLARSQKMEAMGLMASEVAHELNNILSGIIGYPELLVRESNITESQKTILMEMKDAGQRSVAVVSDLLTLASGVAVSKTCLDLNEIVNKVIGSNELVTLQTKFDEALVVKIELNKEMVLLNGSESHIRKMVLNLAINAMEAVSKKDKGLVEISTSVVKLDSPIPGYEGFKPGEYAKLTVSDNGPGIPKEMQAKVFEPFYSTKSGQNRVGLGLAVVSNMVHDHGGYIQLESSSSGTTIFVYFPALKDRKPAAPKAKLDLTKYRGQGEKILVVDDVDIQRKLALKMLKTLGFEGISVSSGEEAVEFLKKTDVDLLILDMIMDPGINGRQTYETILSFKPDQKAIIASGMAENEEVIKAQALGASLFVSKPYSLEDIAQAVHKALNSV